MKPMLINDVERTINKYGLLKKGDKVIIGVSGGSDSVCLLYVLNRLSKKLKFNIHIAHLDHMLRKDSFRDRVFVENIAKKMKLPLSCSQVNVKAILKHSSQEEVARKVRLGFFFKLAQEIGADKIALGHNLDDQAETVLMRILRGSGLQGLGGIFPKRAMDKFIIIRPFIDIPRREIKRFLKKRKIRYRTDFTNLEDIYLRNRIRNRLLPRLEKGYNPRLKLSLSNMAKSTALDYAYLSKLSRRAFLKTCKPIKKKRIACNLSRFLRLDPAIQRMVLRLGIITLKGNLRKITYKHIEEIEDLIHNRPIGSVVDLPTGLQVLSRARVLYLRRRK